MKALDLLIRLLTHSGAEVASLVPVLRSIADNVPDLADEANSWIDQIQRGVTPEGIGSLASTSLGELLALPRTGLDPRDHSSSTV